MMSLTPTFNQGLEQAGKLMEAVDSRNKGPKNLCSILHNRLKFSKISREDLLCMVM